MPSKVERLKAKMANMRKSGERIAKNTLHAGETIVVGAATAYAEGRLSDDTGEWGYKGVPYAYMGAGVLFLTGLFAGDRYSADLFAGGSGAVLGHLSRSMYESGQEAKRNAPQGARQIRSKVSMGLPPNLRPPVQQPAQRQTFGTVFDNMGAR